MIFKLYTSYLVLIITLFNSYISKDINKDDKIYCKSAFDCVNSLCCINNVCKDNDMCQNVNKLVYLIIGLLGIIFITITVIYMLLTIKEAKRNVKVIQEKVFSDPKS